MRLRWLRFMPGFPAILLSIVVLGFWVALTVSPLIHSTEALIHFPENEFFILVPRDGLGFPLIFVETEWRSLPKLVFWESGRKYYPGRFLVDLALAFAAVYILPMTLDRLLFPAIRAARRGKRGAGEVG